MTSAQKKAYVIADNKLALNAGWDEELLALEPRNSLSSIWPSTSGSPASPLPRLLVSTDGHEASIAASSSRVGANRHLFKKQF